MDPSSTAKSERITAIVSTLVAIAILGAGVTAQQSRHTPDDVAQLESDLRFQLETAKRHNAREGALRIAALNEVLRHWNESPRTEDDRQLLVDWLLEATIRSMPGSNEPMPAAPEFGKPATESSAEKTDTIVESTNRISVASAAQTLAQPEQDSVTVRVSKPVASATRSATAQPVEATHASSNITKVSVVYPPTQSQEQIAINLTELVARIAGYHAGLDHVETRLLTLDTPNLKVLAEQIQVLDEMTQDFRFVKLYYDALSESERKTIAPPRSMKATLAEIERLLSMRSGDFFDEFDDAYRAQVEKLRAQLSAVAERMVW